MPACRPGAARRDLTPEGEVEMRGTFSRRPATRVNDPLYAKALYLADGEDRAALVTCDLICVTREMLRAARAKLAGRPRSAQPACGLTRKSTVPSGSKPRSLVMTKPSQSTCVPSAAVSTSLCSPAAAR